MTSTGPVPTMTAPMAENTFFVEKFASDANRAVWLPVSGAWRFESGALVEQLAEGYDHRTLYAGHFSQFTLRVRFRHRQGIGGGVLFNVPDTGSKKSGHMVRYFENNLLVWGYFDQQGMFVGQGSLTVDAPGDQVHTLQISADTATYRILLDDQLVAENVRLVSQQGYIGLTASQSIVAFEAVEVTALAPVQRQIQK